MSEKVTIFEVGPRDGLQNQSAFVPTEQKIAMVNGLAQAGLEKIEVSSFVSPSWVPQLADAADVFQGIARRSATTYSALVPNVTGLKAAIAANVTEVAIFASASERFSQKNINCSIAKSIERFKPVLELASQNNIKVRGYVSCITDCPYEGRIEPAAVTSVTEDLLRLGCYEVSLGDTIGASTSDKITEVLQELLVSVPAEQLAGHFHDTHGRALENIDVCLQHGVRVFDAAVGGLGGCPFAPGAKGNVATEKIVEFLQQKGFETGIDLQQLRKI
ncbi:MAG: hydroxymethylglutaryl-CoA lyase [Paracoccaceae bacterium]